MDGRMRVSTICCAKRRSYCLIKFQDIYTVQYLKNPNEQNRLYTKSFCFILFFVRSVFHFLFKFSEKVLLFFCLLSLK